MRYTSILCMSISAAIGLVLPIILAVYLNRKYKASWKAVFVGMLIFIVFQPLTRLQLLKYLQGTYWYSFNIAANSWLIYILMGFSAGIFEEVGRFIGLKFLLKDKQQWKNGVAYGIGHGGIEAILFCGIPFITVIINYLSKGAGSPQPSLLYLVGGIERLSAMTFHVAASLFVLYAVKNKKYRYLLYAVLLHGILDSSIGFMGGNIPLIEIEAALFAIASLMFIVWKIKRGSGEKILS